MSINIPASNTDPFMRYKRDLLTITHTSKQGGQTHLTNVDVVAKQLGRDSNILMKYFGKCLGVRSDVRTNIIQGVHDRNVLEELLEKYIELSILCKTCHNPETDVVVGKKSTVLKCHACGCETAHL
jgi:translation initiation factor 2 beta subunit (eIF-2beta)/eIF-5